MAPKNNAVDQMAAAYEAQLKAHKETAQALVNELTQVLNDSQSPLSTTNRQAAEKALSYAQQIVSADKTGKPVADPPELRKAEQTAGKSTKPVNAPTAEQTAEKTISTEGQPTGQGSVFGQMYNANQTLTTAGTQYLAAALGSKYLININNKVNTSDPGSLGALSAVVKPGLTAAQILTTLMVNQDQGTIQGIQRELVAAGYLDPLHTTNLQIGSIGTVNDPTLQALANLLESSANHGTPVEKLLTQGQNSRQGKDFANLWDSIVTGQPFTVNGQQTNVSSPMSLADSLRKTSTGDNFGQGVLQGGAGRNPTSGENSAFVTAAQQFQLEHPQDVSTTYVPQPGLGISGFTRFPLQKSQTTTGGADAAAMDQFTYNWVLQNMGSDVAANGAANILAAFNQLIGLGGAATGQAPSSAAGGAA